MFSVSTPQTVPQVAVSVTKKLKDLNFRFFAALDMPFNTHHFNGLTESFYIALHCINI
jgi:hypothetical protein